MPVCVCVCVSVRVCVCVPIGVHRCKDAVVHAQHVCLQAERVEVGGLRLHRRLQQLARPRDVPPVLLEQVGELTQRACVRGRACEHGAVEEFSFVLVVLHAFLKQPEVIERTHVQGR